MKARRNVYQRWLETISRVALWCCVVTLVAGIASWIWHWPRVYTYSEVVDEASMQFIAWATCGVLSRVRQDD